MNYENYTQIQEIINQIHLQNNLLFNLDSERINVIIDEGERLSPYPIFKIAVNAKGESPHEFKIDAELMMARIRCRIKNKIADLKKQLEPL